MADYTDPWVEVDRLTRERDEALKNLTMLHIEWRAELANLREDNDRLRAVLGEVEWRGSAPIMLPAELEPSCPYCGQRRRNDHAPDCRLAAALEGR